MRTGDDNGREEEEDWFAEEEQWQDQPTMEKAASRGEGLRLPPPGSPERRRLVLVSVLAGLLLLVIVAAVLASGDDDADPATTTTPAAGTEPTTTTTPATGTGAQPALVPTGEPLAQGDSGPRVRALQRALNQLGYDVGQPDGQFGPGTAEAVRAFQGDAGLEADGIAGQETIQAINQELREQGG
jgi:Putative peptidoglycan binding domain